MIGVALCAAFVIFTSLPGWVLALGILLVAGGVSGGDYFALLFDIFMNIFSS